jgi:hypothetical protein
MSSPTIADIVAYLNGRGMTAMARVVQIVANDAEQQRRNVLEVCSERDALLLRLAPQSDRTYRAPAESDG